MAIYQKGIWDYLFCKDCEGVLQKYEDHVADFYLNGLWEKALTMPGMLGDAVLLNGINYNRFKILFFSILWRRSLTDKMGIRVDLGPYQEILKNMILSGDAGPEEKFGLLIGRLTLKGRHISGFIGGFNAGRIDGNRCYALVLGGYIIRLMVGKCSLSDCLFKFSTRSSGTQVIFNQPIESEKGLHGLPGMLKKARTPFWDK